MHLRNFSFCLNLIIWVVLVTAQTFAQTTISKLSQTGLYKNISSKEISEDVEEYFVNYPLWSDGLEKKRWILIPKNSQINTKDGNWWEFPVGTKIWKEFSSTQNGVNHLIETRFMHRLKDKWQMVTYLWNAENSEAEVSDGNEYSKYYALGNGVYHNIPANYQCLTCHRDEQGQALVLGFSALQLAHEDGKLNLKTLKALNLLSHELPENISIKSETAEGKKAIGLLSGNCGHCHNPRGLMGYLDMNLKHDIHTTSSEFENAYISTINKYSHYSFPDAQVSPFRILPGNAEGSVLFRRVKASNHLDSFYTEKMPPGSLGNMSPNENLLNALNHWITNLNHLQKFSLERR